jgi:hypothetical protein
MVCGPIDVNNDSILNYIDLDAFRSKYNKTCSDTPPASVCGGTDTNGDGKINYIDLDSFAKRYYPKAQSCQK